MNAIGRTVFLTFTLILSFGILSEIVIQETNELKYLIPRALMGMLLLGVVSTVPLLLYFRTLRIIRTHLINELKLSHQR
ncbi:MAG: EamA domain-containing membrane protein RarD [Roseivirga sp.]|jgi:EamA domain-containing membrane protein RarD